MRLSRPPPQSLPGPHITFKGFADFRSISSRDVSQAHKHALDSSVFGVNQPECKINTMAKWVEQLDSQIAAVLSDWSILTTLLALLIIAIFLQPLLFSEDPDTHPLLLARQSSASPVRNKNESAIYRSPEVPHGYPLRTGLNVKDASAPRWATGRDGDLRDVWREVQEGVGKVVDGSDVPSGLIMTVLGREEVVEHQVVVLSKEIQTMGQHLKDSGVKRVAIYLPNRIEYLLAIFGAS